MIAKFIVSLHSEFYLKKTEMKKYFYLFVAFMAMITFAACSNDEPNAPDLSGEIEKEIVGNYGGNLKIKLFGQEIANVPQEISIKKGAVENSISLSIADFSFMNLSLGGINLENCPLSGKDGNYTFTNDEPLNLAPFEGFSAVVNLKSGTIVNEEITLVLDIDALLGEEKQKVEVTYTGKRGQAVEEEKSNEAKILSFEFDADYENHPMHKVLVASEAVIDESAKTITFIVDKEILSEEGNENALKELYPVISVSEGATYSPTEGFDFSNPDSPVIITVTSEDGKTTADYTVKVEITKGKGAQILSFEFDMVNPVHGCVITPVASIDEKSKKITFKVKEELFNTNTKLYPTITVSAGATYSPSAGDGIDFSNSESPVKITVTSEDGSSIVEYSVNCISIPKEFKYDFEEWTRDESQSQEKLKYPIAKGWDTCNQAVMMVMAWGNIPGFSDPIVDYTGGWPVKSIEESYSGNYAASIESVDTKGTVMMGQKVPKVTAGTIFLGKFNAMAALGGAMKATEFGIIYGRKPLKVSGFYKYTPGSKFYNANGELVNGKEDECSISAVLYEVKNDKETLDGSNIYTSEKIVAKAMFKSSKTVTEYTPFELKLEYSKEYDPSKKYKFAVIFSASADGAAYNAAVGSKLIIDDVVVVNE